MPDTLPHTLRIPPRPPAPTRVRGQVDGFFVLRRNPLELWGAPAYEEDILFGRFLGREQVLLNAPDAIRQVLVTNAEKYGRSPATIRVLRPIIGEGLFLAEGAAWRHQRRTIAPALAPRTMGLLARHVVTASEEFEAGLEKRLYRPVQLLPLLQLLALEVAGTSMFSLQTAEFSAELRALITKYGLRYGRPGLFDLVLPAPYPSTLDFGRDRFRREWLAFLGRVIEARRAQPAPDSPRDLFDLLEAARDPETGEGFGEAQLRDEVSTMIIAGHETTAVTLFWSCYLAALYPDLADRIAAEAAPLDLSPETAGEAIRSLPYTRAFIDESLRLYPPAFLIVRQAMEADVIDGRAIVPGTVISISPWVVHRHRRLWRDPDVFDPDRFLPGATPPERFAYLPFGAGPRVCVGMQFALTEAVLVLARLLRRYRLRLVGGGEVMPRGLVTVQPDRPVRFELAPRT